MKKGCKILMAVVLVISLCFMTGCGKDQESDNSTDTVASKLAQEFKNEMKKEKDPKAVAEKLSKDYLSEISVQVEELDENSYIAGFNTEIKGYKNGYAIRPMIGTIPFIAYIFEVNDTDNFVKTLTDNADLRWNICTEADEMQSAVVDNYVFFVMSPENFD